MKELANGELICNDHSTAYLNSARRKSKSTGFAKPAAPIALIVSRAVSSKKAPPKVKPNINDVRMEEVNEYRKKEEERRRSATESREMRMKRRSSVTLTPTGTPTKKVKVFIGDISQTNHSATDSNVQKATDQAMSVDDLAESNGSISSSSQVSDAVKAGGSVPMSNGLQSEQRSGETTKEKIVQDDVNNNLSEKRPEPTGLGISSSASSVVKSISQKENRVSMEIEPLQTVGKILSDEILFEDESNESCQSEQTASQSNGTAPAQLNGKRLEQPSNDASHLSNNDENKNHNKNHKLTTAIGSNGISEISEPAS